MLLGVEFHLLSERNPWTILPHHPEWRAIPKGGKNARACDLFLLSHAEEIPTTQVLREVSKKKSVENKISTNFLFWPNHLLPTICQGYLVHLVLWPRGLKLAWIKNIYWLQNKQQKLQIKINECWIKCLRKCNILSAIRLHPNSYSYL